MKATVLQDDLIKGLTAVSRFVATRNPLPVLSNILFVLEKGKLKLSATNLEMGISLQIGAKIEEEGALTVPAKVIVELVSNLPSGQIQLESTEGQLEISTNSFSATVSGISSSEFPLIPEKIEKKDLSLPYSVIKSISDKVVFAAANDESRPVLTGVLMFFEKNKISAVATDGFRLSLLNINIKNESKDHPKLLVPAKVLEEVSKIFPVDDNVDVSILVKERQLIFSNGSITLVGRVIEGDFPDFERIVPKQFTYKAITGRDVFARAVKASAVFAREAASIVKIKIEDGKITVSAESHQYGKESVTVEAKTEGGEVEIAFNYKFVLEFLASADSQEIIFETENATSPGVFKDALETSWIHLIMPVRIQS